jgi:hypothetical protein
MRKGKAMRRYLVLAALTAAMLVVAQPATADPSNSSCPNGTDWELTTVEDAAATIWPLLVNKDPWDSQYDYQESAIRPEDTNGDGDVCLKTVAQSNPNANWYGVPLFIARDNNANAA